MLLGEYAVVEDGLALVTAVSCRASGEIVRAPKVASPLLTALRVEGATLGFDYPQGLHIDTSTFQDPSGHKLGLGSSSSAAVVASALITQAGDETTLDLAVRGHRRAADGAGSGVDVAASFYGGVLAARRQPGPVTPLPSRLPGLQWTLLFTGHSANTAEFVSRCQKAPSWPKWMAVMKALADEGVRAYQWQKSPAFLSATARYARAMASLGKDAGVPIVTEQLDAIIRLASEAKAAAKPSGAGGGDIAIVWSTHREVALELAHKTQCQALEFDIDPHGLILEGEKNEMG